MYLVLESVFDEGGRIYYFDNFEDANKKFKEFEAEARKDFGDKFEDTYECQEDEASKEKALVSMSVSYFLLKFKPGESYRYY